MLKPSLLSPFCIGDRRFVLILTGDVNAHIFGGGSNFPRMPHSYATGGKRFHGSAQ